MFYQKRNKRRTRREYHGVEDLKGVDWRRSNEDEKGVKARRTYCVWKVLEGNVRMVLLKCEEEDKEETMAEGLLVEMEREGRREVLVCITEDMHNGRQWEWRQE